MPTMRAIQVAKKGGPFELVRRESPQPGRGEVRVKVQACGVCHSDSIAKDGLFPSVPYRVGARDSGRH
jgi:D-arabinose 1-dehydrogenase-like Zn-dependent alcohol dehydrogenase